MPFQAAIHSVIGHRQLQNATMPAVLISSSLKVTSAELNYSTMLQWSLPNSKMNQVTCEGSSCQLPMLHFVAKIENHQIALRHFRFQDFFKKNLGCEKQGPPVLTTGSQKMGRSTKEGNSDRLSPRCWGYSTPMNFFGRPSTHTSQKSPKVCSLVQSAILSFNNFHPMDLSLHPSALKC